MSIYQVMKQHKNHTEDIENKLRRKSEIYMKIYSDKIRVCTTFYQIVTNSSELPQKKISYDLITKPMAKSLNSKEEKNLNLGKKLCYTTESM